MDTKHDYRVFWFEADKEYVAICDEYPLLSWMDEDPIAALTGLIKLMTEEGL